MDRKPRPQETKNLLKNKDFRNLILLGFAGTLIFSLCAYIYKAASVLSFQNELLKKDKVRLADAIADISHQLKTPLTSWKTSTAKFV